jgi:hypothetical protein
VQLEDYKHHSVSSRTLPVGSAAFSILCDVRVEDLGRFTGGESWVQHDVFVVPEILLRRLQQAHTDIKRYSF